MDQSGWIHASTFTLRRLGLCFQLVPKAGDSDNISLFPEKHRVHVEITRTKVTHVIHLHWCDADLISKVSVDYILSRSVSFQSRTVYQLHPHVSHSCHWYTLYAVWWHHQPNQQFSRDRLCIRSREAYQVTAQGPNEDHHEDQKCFWKKRLNRITKFRWFFFFFIASVIISVPTFWSLSIEGEISWQTTIWLIM